MNTRSPRTTIVAGFGVGVDVGGDVDSFFLSCSASDMDGSSHTD